MNCQLLDVGETGVHTQTANSLDQVHICVFVPSKMLPPPTSDPESTDFDRPK